EAAVLVRRAGLLLLVGQRLLRDEPLVEAVTDGLDAGDRLRGVGVGLALVVEELPAGRRHQAGRLDRQTLVLRVLRPEAEQVRILLLQRLDRGIQLLERLGRAVEARL